MIAVRIPSPRSLQHMRRKRRHTGPRDDSLVGHDLKVERTPSDNAVLRHGTRTRGRELEDAVVEALQHGRGAGDGQVAPVEIVEVELPSWVQAGYGEDFVGVCAWD